VTLYRQKLAAATGLVDIVSIGLLNNLSDLLQSAADGISSLTGLQLVAAKVNHLWVMGGLYSKGAEHNFNATSVGIAASSYVVSNWPTPITYLGYEVGATVLTGSTVSGLQPGDYLAQAMSDYGTFNRSSWDPMCGMVAIIGDPQKAGYMPVYGSNSVSAVDGSNIFTPDASGRDRYLVKGKPDSYYAGWINTKILKSNW